MTDNFITWKAYPNDYAQNQGLDEWVVQDPKSYETIADVIHGEENAKLIERLPSILYGIQTVCEGLNSISDSADIEFMQKHAQQLRVYIEGIVEGRS